MITPFSAPCVAVCALLMLARFALCGPTSAPLSASAVTPQEVVQQFLDDRAVGQLEKAFLLLSPVSRAEISLSAFLKGQSDLEQPSDPSDPVIAMADMLADTHHRLGYQFVVEGTVKDHSGWVWVSARPPGGLGYSKVYGCHYA